MGGPGTDTMKTQGLGRVAAKVRKMWRHLEEQLARPSFLDLENVSRISAWDSASGRSMEADIHFRRIFLK